MTEPMDTEQLRAELRQEIQVELTPMLERVTLMAEEKLEQLTQLEQDCKRAKLHAFDRMLSGRGRQGGCSTDKARNRARSGAE